MNWSDETVEKVAAAIYDAPMPSLPNDEGNLTSFVEYNKTHPLFCSDIRAEAQAALSAIALQDIAKLPEVKALVEAIESTVKSGSFAHLDKRISDKLMKALTPFTEASNE